MYRMSGEVLTSSGAKIPILPLLLGYAGLIPFIVSACGIWLASTGMAVVLNQALLSYAACILAFMGAIHWGYAMRSNADSWQLGLSVLPSLFAWLALNLPLPWAYAILTINFILLCIFDGVASRSGLLPWWYPSLRVPLTAIVVMSLIIGAFGAVRL